VRPVNYTTNPSRAPASSGRFGSADRLLECRLCESQNFFLFDSDRGVNCVWKRLVLRNSFFPATRGSIRETLPLKTRQNFALQSPNWGPEKFPAQGAVLLSFTLS
jgi:hypothetical protein